MGLFGKFFKPNIEKMKKNRDVEGLIRALKHKDGSARLEAVRALRELKDKRAVGPLIEALRDNGSIDYSGSIRGLAAAALGELKDRRAVEPLIQALKDKSKTVRRDAAEALDELGWRPRDDTEMAHYLIAKGGPREKARKRAMDWWRGGEWELVRGDGFPEVLMTAPPKVINRGYAFCDVCDKKIPVGEGYVLDSKEQREMLSPLTANLPKPLLMARIDAIINGTFITDSPELEAKVKLARIGLGPISSPAIRDEQIRHRGWANFTNVICDECIPKLIKR